MSWLAICFAANIAKLPTQFVFNCIIASWELYCTFTNFSQSLRWNADGQFRISVPLHFRELAVLLKAWNQFKLCNTEYTIILTIDAVGGKQNKLVQHCYRWITVMHSRMTRRSPASVTRITGSHHCSFTWRQVGKNSTRPPALKLDYWTYWNLQMSCFALLRQLTVFEILTFETFDLEKLGQSQRVQHSQWWYSMANVEIYKCHLLQFCASLHRFREIDIWRKTMTYLKK